jgi:formylglycine-generating enzyme required for sulfatase activity
MKAVTGGFSNGFSWHIRAVYILFARILLSLGAGAFSAVLIFIQFFQRNFFSLRYLFFTLAVFSVVTLIVFAFTPFAIQRVRALGKLLAALIVFFSLTFTALILTLHHEFQPFYYWLPEKDLEITFSTREADAEYGPVRLLGIQNLWGYIHYSNLEIEGQWEHQPGQLLFRPGQDVAIHWHGRVGPWLKIVFGQTEFNQAAQIVLEDQADLFELSLADETVKLFSLDDTISWRHYLPHGLSLFMVMFLSILSFLLAASQWDARLLFILVCVFAGSQRRQIPPISRDWEHLRLIHPLLHAEIIYIPPGPFLMGTDGNDPLGREEEIPLHQVKMDAFWISSTPVTNSMYNRCVDAGVCKYDYSPKKYPRFLDPRFADHPVVYVTWNSAQKFCQWTGGRLPTEAEWEKAARGTAGQLYPWGDSWHRIHLANVGNIVGDTTRVGFFPNDKSPYGVLDMGGNVREWVADWYDPYYYQGTPLSNPTGPEEGEKKVLRSAGWWDDDIFSRAANRLAHAPRSPGINRGFRCAYP